MSEYKNASEIYTENYMRLDFRDSTSYDIGIHAIQTALYIQDYNDKAGININDIVFGYYDVNTEKMIKQFQINNDIKPSEGVLNKETWDAIFYGLSLKGVGLIITGEKEITIVDNDTRLDSGNNSGKYATSESENFNNDDNQLDSVGNIDFANTRNHTLSDDLNDDDFGKNLYAYIRDTNNSGFIDNYVTGTGGYLDPNFGQYVTNGSITSTDPGDYNLLGKKSVVSGISSLTDGNNRWNDTSISSLNDNDYQRDYDFIYNLLANTAYSAGGYTNPLQSSNSTTDTLENYSGSYENSSNKPFFNPNNINTLRRSKFDITIVYGAKGKKARKLINVVPMSVTQEMNASGEPIYDVYEFVAKDVVYSTDNN